MSYCHIILFSFLFFYSSLAQINSNSILLALLDSKYTEFSELIDKALLLQSLENVVGKDNITIFAPENEAMERNLNPEFKRFLLEPRNLKSLQSLILHHIVPTRVDLVPTRSTQVRTLSNHHIHLPSLGKTHPDKIQRQDGIIHGINKLLIPQGVLQEFNARRELSSISAELPKGAPTIESRSRKMGKAGAPSPPTPAIPIFSAPAPGPALAPAPAPGPGGPHHHFDGASQVKDFITTLVHYGSYNELADILVNLTTLATEMGRLVSEGYTITVLAPNDEAMAKLTSSQLVEPGAPERMIYYHIIAEYQTEESMYSAVRRFGKVKYETLHYPHKVVAEEADGSVRFGKGDGSGYLVDPDIYTDGRISVQGIDSVLFPDDDVVMAPAAGSVRKIAPRQRRGKLLEVACTLAGPFGLC